MLITPITPKVMERPIADNSSTEPKLKPKKIFSAKRNAAMRSSMESSANCACCFTFSSASLFAISNSAVRTSCCKLPRKMVIASKRTCCSLLCKFINATAAVMAVRTSSFGSVFWRSSSSRIISSSTPSAIMRLTASKRTTALLSFKFKAAKRVLSWVRMVLLMGTRLRDSVASAAIFSPLIAFR